MGWTYGIRNRNKSILDLLRDEFCRSEPHRIIDAALVKMRTVYAAYHTKEGDVVALVILVDLRTDSKEGWNFGYKEMSEDMGPCERECPGRILRLLTPTENKWALEWRKACWERLQKQAAKPKVRIGDWVIFDQPIKFRNGAEHNRLQLMKSTGRFRGPDGGAYRFGNWRKEVYTVVPRPEVKIVIQEREGLPPVSWLEDPIGRHIRLQEAFWLGDLRGVTPENVETFARKAKVSVDRRMEFLKEAV